MHAFPAWFPYLADRFESSEIFARGTAAVLAVLPAGFLMGVGFPADMRLVSAIDPRPTPWFWGVDGAAGVLASGIATGISISSSIDVALRLGAVVYLLVGLAAAQLLRSWSPRAEAAGDPLRASAE